MAPEPAPPTPSGTPLPGPHRYNYLDQPDGDQPTLPSPARHVHSRWEPPGGTNLGVKWSPSGHLEPW